MTRGMRRKAKVCGYLAWISYSVAAIPGFWFDDMTVWSRTITFAVIGIATFILFEDKKEVEAEKERQRKCACRAKQTHRG